MVELRKYHLRCKHYKDGNYYFVCTSNDGDDPMFIKTTSYEYYKHAEGDLIAVENEGHVYGETFTEMLIRITEDGIFDRQALEIILSGEIQKLMEG